MKRRSCRATGAGRSLRRADAAGAMSATRASRGAPRMPLPTRSTKRAANQPFDRRRQRKDRLGKRRQAIAERGQGFALAKPVAQRAGEHLGDRRGRLGDAFNDADGERRSAEHRHHDRAAAARGSSPRRCPSASRRNRESRPRPEYPVGPLHYRRPRSSPRFFRHPSRPSQRFSLWASKALCGDTANNATIATNKQSGSDCPRTHRGAGQPPLI